MKQTFTMAIALAVSVMAVWAALCYAFSTPMVEIFSSDAQVVAVGREYLHIIAWSFVCSGIVFVTSSMFQALGNTLPALAASFTRLLLTAIPAILMSNIPGFELRWLWYLSASTVLFQVALILFLLQREFRLRLWPIAMAAPSSATAGTS